jgi:uncharacterized membrane-anchored protein
LRPRRRALAIDDRRSQNRGDFHAAAHFLARVSRFMLGWPFVAERMQVHRRGARACWLRLLDAGIAAPS